MAAMVAAAKLEQTEHGVAPATDGWFTLNLRDAVWRHADGRGAVCVALDDFEGERRAVQFGVNPFVLQPGEPMSMYHWEADQEAFLVVSGEAVLIVEGEERQLRAWDFVHCPPQTKHVIVGAGTGPCVVIAVGARDRDELGFPGRRGRKAARCGRRRGDDRRRGRVRVRPGPRADRVPRGLASRVASPAGSDEFLPRIRS
jgi:uncharacterized cupin superfamily protein